jgi:hypothetical protein
MAHIVRASVVRVAGIATIGSANGERAGSGVAKVVVQIPACGSAGLGSVTIDFFALS